jgi:hypothetical protein
LYFNLLEMSDFTFWDCFTFWDYTLRRGTAKRNSYEYPENFEKIVKKNCRMVFSAYFWSRRRRTSAVIDLLCTCSCPLKRNSRPCRVAASPSARSHQIINPSLLVAAKSVRAARPVAALAKKGLSLTNARRSTNCKPAAVKGFYYMNRLVSAG